MTAFSREELQFWERRAGPSITHRHLSKLTSDTLLDPQVLVRWILVEPPLAIDETPYVGIASTLSVSATETLTPEMPSSRTEAVRGLRQMLETAVERAVGGSRRVAVLTGGGVDSGALLGLADRALRAVSGSAFGVALDFHADGDDRPHLAALERHLGCEVIRVSPEDAADRRELIAGIDAAPFANPLGPLEIEALARARAHGAELVLTGLGGDELFDGVPTAIADLERPLSAIRAARSLRGFGSPRAFDWAIRPALTRFVPRRVRMWRARRARSTSPRWAGPLVRKAVADSHVSQLEALERQLRARSQKDAMTDQRWRIFAAWYRHQQEFASGIERRDPFIDRQLVAWVDALPPVWLLEGGVRRGLFREAIRGLVPESLRMRDDKAYFEPAMFRFVESIGGFRSLDALARASHLADLGIVEPRAFREEFDELAAAPIGSLWWGSVWGVLAAESFLMTRGVRCG